MSIARLRPFGVPAEQLDNGIEPSGSNLSDMFHFGDEVENVHKAQYDGFGPRYGMAPLPYHNIPSGTSQPSLVDLEGTGSLQEKRSRLYGIVPLRLATYSSVGPLGPSAVHYAWICLSESQSVIPFQNALALYMNVSTGADPQPYASGLDLRLSRYAQFDGSTAQFMALFTGAYPFLKRRIGNWPNDWASLAQMTVPGRVIPAPWLLGFLRAAASGSTPPLASIDFGYTSEFAYLNQDARPRSIRVFHLEQDSFSNVVTRTQYNTTAQSGYYLFRNLYTKATTDIDSAKVTFSTTATYGVAGAYSSTNFVLYNDEDAKHNQRHNLIAVAFGKPYGYVLKEEFLTSFSQSGTLPFIPVDFTGFQYFPRERQTQSQTSGASPYTENGVTKPTCWRSWPIWAAGTPTANDATLPCGTSLNNVALGAAGTGVLRQNTTYEFTFSVYNRAFGHETNVGVPARIETGTDDYVCLHVRRSATDTGNSTGVSLAVAPDVSTGPFPYDFFFGNINHFQYRVYYRELGTFEWLPAGEIDCADYHYNASERTRRVCEGAIAALPGGQPGGYNDYSALPDDEYFQCLTFERRLFWFSPKSLVFSLKDNPYAYSVRNAVGCPKGAFLGAIVHSYPGEAEQGARMVIFTTEETVVGRFLGQDYGIQQPVRVSPDSVGTFYLDGSDFNIQTWTSITAFSHRAAVNAKGVLYWWGPDGIYRDDGVSIPSKEWSEYMDPFLSGLYDKTQTQKIHGVYNSRTREILWFFLAADGTQKALVYNTKADSFFVFSFSNILIDSAQQIDVKLTGDATRSPISGPRILLMCRDAVDTSTAQRAVFFDELVDAGDLRISKALMARSLVASGSNLDISFIGGYTGALPTSGKATIHNAQAYLGSAYDGDGIYDIVGGDGSTYIRISPTNGHLPPATGILPSAGMYFPVWIESIHGFSLRARSEFWAPAGFLFYGRWLYCEQLFKIDLMTRTSGFQVKMEWLSTAGSDTPNTRVLTLSDNYRGNYRVHSQMFLEEENGEGQGISTTWTTPTGLHNGGRWYIQYLSYLVDQLPEENNRSYEG